MKTSISCQLECPTSIFGFCLTDKYMVVAAQTVIVHSLQCPQCQRDRGQVCSNHHAVFEIGLIWHAQVHEKSSLMLTASHAVPGSMGLWDLEDGNHVRDFVGQSDHVKRVLFLDEGDTYASGSQNGAVMTWKRRDERPTHTLRGHTAAILGLASHADRLISSSDDRTIRVWDLVTGACFQVLDHSSHVSYLKFSSDYNILYAGGGGNGEIRMWNWRNRCVKTRRTGDNFQSTHLVHSRDPAAIMQAEAKEASQVSEANGNLVTCGVDGVIRSWAREGGLVKEWAAHDAPIRGLVRIGRFGITVGSKDGRVKVWDWENRDWLFDLEGPVHVISRVVAGHGKIAVASWDKEHVHRMHVWELDEIHVAALGHVNRVKTS